MKAIIPAAGIGTRLRPHTHSRPKAMLEVAGKPIIGHIIDTVLQSDPEEIFIIVGYKKEVLTEWVSKTYPDQKITYIEQEKMLGLGHAVLMAEKHISGDDALFILLGDTLVDIDSRAFTSSRVSSLGVKTVDDPRRFGVVELKNDRILKLIEKPQNPPTNLALIGVYFIKSSKRLFDAIHYIIDNNITTKGEYQITDALNRCVELGEEMTVHKVDNWFDCGTYETLLETNKFLLSKTCRTESRLLGDSVIIEPVIIGKNVTIKHSVVGPFCSIADDCVLENTIVSNSILYEKATLKNASLVDSILGENTVFAKKSDHVNIGAHSEITYN